MTTSKNRIAAGLDTREREKSGTTNPYSHLNEVPQTTAEVNRLAVRAKTLRDRFKQIADGVKSDLAKYRVEAEVRFADLGKAKDENGVTRDSLGSNQRKVLLEKDIATYRKNTLSRSTGDRAGILAELKDINRKLASVADLHSDGVAILMTSTLGSKRRGDFTRDLENAGPREIELAVKRALVHGDRDLLAACYSRIDSLPTDTRKNLNVSKKEAAEHLVANQLQLGLQSLALADVSLIQAEVAEDEVNGKRIASQRKIGLGVKKAELRKLGIDLDSESDDGGINKTGDLLSDDQWQKNLNAKFPAVPVPEGTVIIGRESST